MANELTTSTLDDLYEDIVAEALFTANERSVMRPLVTEYDMSGTKGMTTSVPIYPTVTASAVAEATDLSNTAVSTSEATMTLGEHGVMVTLTDFSRDTSFRDVATDIGKMLGEAIAKRMDQDLLTLFSSFSSATPDHQIGAAGSEITAANLFQSSALLRIQSAPGSAVAVVHPGHAYELKSILTNSFASTNLSDLGNEALRKGFIGEFAGMQVFESANIAVDGSDDAVAGVFSKEAIGLAIRNDLKLEFERDASLRATEIVATGVWGEGVLKDTYGVGITADTLLN